MRFFLFAALLAVLVALVSAWEKEDHEIFDLVHAVENSEGKGTTFYSWLGVDQSANSKDIGKAYRKLSMQLHPDKNPNVPNIQERFARLGVIATILRNKESRKRYDFFYKNGVPKWRGTGYYYSRFRPGLGTVTTFLIILTSGLQFLVQRINHKRDLQRIEKITGDAKLAAWGPKMIPVSGQRKVRVNLGGPQRVDDDGSPIPGRTIDMVVDGQDVYIVDPSGDLELIDASTAGNPSIFNTWFINLLRHGYSSALSRVHPTPSSNDSANASVADEGSESEFSSGTSTPRDSDSAATGVAKGLSGKKPASKAGGRRQSARRR